MVTPAEEASGRLACRLQVEIRAIRAHPGAPALPLHKGASRRRAVADHAGYRGGHSPKANTSVPTFVFDEVADAGELAVRRRSKIGPCGSRKLARLAQVIVVTHLPQVAAASLRRHRLVLVEKDRRYGSVVHSWRSAASLVGDGRVRRLSRMLMKRPGRLEFGRAHTPVSYLEAAAAGRCRTISTADSSRLGDRLPGQSRVLSRTRPSPEPNSAVKEPN